MHYEIGTLGFVRNITTLGTLVYVGLRSKIYLYLFFEKHVL